MENIENLIETLVTIFTVESGAIKVLLMRRGEDPYKGYWMLPSAYAQLDKSLELTASECVVKRTGLPDLSLLQDRVYSSVDRKPDHRVIAVNYIGLVDTTTVFLKQEQREEYSIAWFDVTQLPKLAFDHEVVIQQAKSALKTILSHSENLRLLFPSDFALPEVQRVYEIILEKQLDRRNFRKKFMNYHLIEATGENTEGHNGRPAKLYRFKENTKEFILF